MGVMCSFCNHKREMEILCEGYKPFICDYKDQTICLTFAEIIFKGIDHIGFDFRINPREISKGVVIYDDCHIYSGYTLVSKRSVSNSINSGDPKQENKDNDKYMRIKKDEQGRQYLHLLIVDSGGYDCATTKLYFDNDQDLLNFLRRE